MPHKLSPSTISLLKDCSRCFWLHCNKGIKRPRGIFPSLPGGVDAVLKRHFDACREKGELPPELQAHNVPAKLFADTKLLDIWRSNRRGISWKDEQGNILRGAVDDLLHTGDKLIVVDFKTRGYPLKEETSGYYDDQMDLYNFLFRKNGFPTADFSYLLFYYPVQVQGHGLFQFNVELVQVPVKIANAEQLWQAAITVLEGEMPVAADGCVWCGWGRKQEG